MAEFFYRGRNESGQPVEGTLQGNSKSSVIQQLKRQNIVATFVDSAEGKHSRGLKTSGTDIDFKSLFKKKKVSLDELIMFSRQMYALTRAGIPLIRAINGLADASRSPLLGEILRDISRSLTQGTTLSNAFRVHIDTFGELFIAMIRMGETTGRLDSAFAQLIDHLELEKDTRKKIIAATRYPIIVSVFIFIPVACSIGIYRVCPFNFVTNTPLNNCRMVTIT